MPISNSLVFIERDELKALQTLAQYRLEEIAIYRAALKDVRELLRDTRHLIELDGTFSCVEPMRRIDAVLLKPFSSATPYPSREGVCPCCGRKLPQGTAKLPQEAK